MSGGEGTAGGGDGVLGGGNGSASDVGGREAEERDEGGEGSASVVGGGGASNGTGGEGVDVEGEGAADDAGSGGEAEGEGIWSEVGGGTVIGVGAAVGGMRSDGGDEEGGGGGGDAGFIGVSWEVSVVGGEVGADIEWVGASAISGEGDACVASGGCGVRFAHRGSGWDRREAAAAVMGDGTGTAIVSAFTDQPCIKVTTQQSMGNDWSDEQTTMSRRCGDEEEMGTLEDADSAVSLCVRRPLRQRGRKGRAREMSTRTISYGLSAARLRAQLSSPPAAPVQCSVACVTTPQPTSRWCGDALLRSLMAHRQFTVSEER